jgi:hypothetical protein
MRQVRSHMADFLIDCHFNSFCKGRKTFFSPISCYAKKLCYSALCSIAKSSDSALCGIVWSLKIFLPTPRYAAQRGVDMWHCGESRLRAMWHNAELYTVQLLYGVGWSRKWIFYLRVSRHFFVSIFTYA